MITKNSCSFQVLVEKDAEEKMFEAETWFNEKMYKHGIRLTCSPSRNQGRRGVTRYALILSMDQEIIGRHSGRKPPESKITMEEAMRQESDGIDKKTIANNMGVSLATYYRKRKEYTKTLEDNG